ncbi:MAG: Putative oxidoreductase, partial [uncultured Thermomicrobiales bacterium]
WNCPETCSTCCAGRAPATSRPPWPTVRPNSPRPGSTPTASTWSSTACRVSSRSGTSSGTREWRSRSATPTTRRTTSRSAVGWSISPRRARPSTSRSYPRSTSARPTPGTGAATKCGWSSPSSPRRSAASG